MPVNPLPVGLALLMTFTVTAGEAPLPATDMALIEFLGSLDTEGASGTEVLIAIDTGLLPELPEEPPNEDK